MTSSTSNSGRAAFLAALLPIVLAGPGCRNTPPPAPPVAPAAPEPAAPVTTQELRIGLNHAGPVRLGMTMAEVRRQPNLTALPVTVRLDGRRVEALSVTRFGAPLLLGELQDGRLAALRVYSPTYRGPAGTAPGMRAVEVGKRLGEGRVRRLEKRAVVEFPSAPGYTFYFPLSERTEAEWRAVMQANPRLECIRVRGGPESGRTRPAEGVAGNRPAAGGGIPGR